MKRPAFLFFQTVVLSSMVFAQTTGEISANFKGMENDTIFILYSGLNSNKTYRDTLIAHNNQFKYRLPINEPVDIAIIPKKAFHQFPSGRFYVPNTKFINLIIRPTDKIMIEGILCEKYLDYQIEGSLLNETLDSLRNVYKPFDIAAVNDELQLENLDENNEYLSKSIFNNRIEATQEMSQIKLRYIAQHLNKEVAAFLLLKQPLEVFAKYYLMLSDNVRNGIFTQPLKKKFEQYEKYTETNVASQKIKEGNIAPDFSLPDLDGRPFQLSKVNCKYLVIDFWGTWCGWCVEEFPKMKEYYHKYKSKIEFIGIACNDKEKAWKEAVEKYQLDWKQVLNASSQDVAVLYGIKVFPTKIILDQDLKIIKIFNGASPSFFQELDRLMQ